LTPAQFRLSVTRQGSAHILGRQMYLAATVVLTSEVRAV
jgi:hypothetical protein